MKAWNAVLRRCHILCSIFLGKCQVGKYVMGLTKAEEPSHRCVGLSEKLFGQAGVVKQAAPLKVDQILVIHDALLSDNTSRWDRAFARGIVWPCSPQ